MRHESDRYRPIEGLELEMRDRLATKDAEITRLKADVTNRDEAIERMRRERSARVMGAHMDRVEAALGFQGGKPVIIDMVIARIEQLNAALARVRGLIGELPAISSLPRSGTIRAAVEVIDDLFAFANEHGADYGRLSDRY